MFELMFPFQPGWTCTQTPRRYSTTSVAALNALAEMAVRIGVKNSQRFFGLHALLACVE